MRPFHPIVLLTDFGTKDAYVASMKGVILSLFPRATLIDLTHEVEAQNVLQAAFLLEATYSYFPRGSIFVSVVDPGVGSERRILAAKTLHGIFLAPDNGILTQILEKEKAYETRVVTDRHFFLGEVSHTFHGRDCFAPTAARLAKDPSLFSRLGPKIQEWTRLDFPKPQIKRGKISGQILFFDHFGNAFTNISRKLLESHRKGPRSQIQVQGKSVGPVRKSYHEARKGEALAVISSSNFLEIAVNHGSAREKLKLQKGVRVEVS